MKRIGLTGWIMIALVLGFVLGNWFPEWAHAVKPLRTVFLNGIKCIIAPLIFASIVTGINSSKDGRGLGRIAIKAFFWFELASALALAIGLFFVNWLRPGDGVVITAPAEGAVNAVAPTLPLTWHGFIEHLLPTNFAEAVVHGDVLQIVLISVIFGLAIAHAGERARPVLAFCEGLAAVMFKFTALIMYMAPIGVGAAIAGSVAEHGWQMLWPMARLVGTLYLALIVFVALVLLPALKVAGVAVGAFFRELRPSLVLAFATTSSESAFPTALESLAKLGVPPAIANFVLPLGYSFNLDGSTLYLSVASVFIAQAAHIELSLGQQISMMLLLMVTTKGVAAVPRASMVVLSATLTAFGLPLEGVLLILGVDEIMDMARTTVNLLGNCVAAMIIAHWQGESHWRTRTAGAK